MNCTHFGKRALHNSSTVKPLWNLKNSRISVDMHRQVPGVLTCVAARKLRKKKRLVSVPTSGEPCSPWRSKKLRSTWRDGTQYNLQKAVGTKTETCKWSLKKYILTFQLKRLSKYNKLSREQCCGAGANLFLTKGGANCWRQGSIFYILTIEQFSAKIIRAYFWFKTIRIFENNKDECVIPLMSRMNVIPLPRPPGSSPHCWTARTGLCL